MLQQVAAAGGSRTNSEGHSKKSNNRGESDPVEILDSKQNSESDSNRSFAPSSGHHRAGDNKNGSNSNGSSGKQHVSLSSQDKDSSNRRSNSNSSSSATQRSHTSSSSSSDRYACKNISWKVHSSELCQRRSSNYTSKHRSCSNKESSSRSSKEPVFLITQKESTRSREDFVSKKGQQDPISRNTIRSSETNREKSQQRTTRSPPAAGAAPKKVAAAAAVSSPPPVSAKVLLNCSAFPSESNAAITAATSSSPSAAVRKAPKKRMLPRKPTAAVHRKQIPTAAAIAEKTAANRRTELLYLPQTHKTAQNSATCSNNTASASNFTATNTQPPEAVTAAAVFVTPAAIKTPSTRREGSEEEAEIASTTGCERAESIRTTTASAAAAALLDEKEEVDSTTADAAVSTCALRVADTLREVAALPQPSTASTIETCKIAVSIRSSAFLSESEAATTTASVEKAATAQPTIAARVERAAEKRGMVCAMSDDDSLSAAGTRKKSTPISVEPFIEGGENGVGRSSMKHEYCEEEESAAVSLLAANFLELERPRRQREWTLSFQKEQLSSPVSAHASFYQNSTNKSLSPARPSEGGDEREEVFEADDGTPSSSSTRGEGCSNYLRRRSNEEPVAVSAAEITTRHSPLTQQKPHSPTTTSSNSSRTTIIAEACFHPLAPPSHSSRNSPNRGGGAAAAEAEIPPTGSSWMQQLVASSSGGGLKKVSCCRVKQARLPTVHAFEEEQLKLEEDSAGSAAAAWWTNRDLYEAASRSPRSRRASSSCGSRRFFRSSSSSGGCGRRVISSGLDSPVLTQMRSPERTSQQHSEELQLLEAQRPEADVKSLQLHAVDRDRAVVTAAVTAAAALLDKEEQLQQEVAHAMSRKVSSASALLDEKHSALQRLKHVVEVQDLQILSLRDLILQKDDEVESLQAALRLAAKENAQLQQQVVETQQVCFALKEQQTTYKEALLLDTQRQQASLVGLAQSEAESQEMERQRISYELEKKTRLIESLHAQMAAKEETIYELTHRVEDLQEWQEKISSGQVAAVLQRQKDAEARLSLAEAETQNLKKEKLSLLQKLSELESGMKQKDEEIRMTRQQQQQREEDFYLQQRQLHALQFDSQLLQMRFDQVQNNAKNREVALDVELQRQKEQHCHAVNLELQRQQRMCHEQALEAESLRDTLRKYEREKLHLEEGMRKMDELLCLREKQMNELQEQLAEMEASSLLNDKSVQVELLRRGEKELKKRLGALMDENDILQQDALIVAQTRAENVSLRLQLQDAQQGLRRQAAQLAVLRQAAATNKVEGLLSYLNQQQLDMEKTPTTAAAEGAVFSSTSSPSSVVLVASSDDTKPSNITQTVPFSVPSSTAALSSLLAPPPTSSTLQLQQGTASFFAGVKTPPNKALLLPAPTTTAANSAAAAASTSTTTTTKPNTLLLQPPRPHHNRSKSASRGDALQQSTATTTITTTTTTPTTMTTLIGAPISFTSSRNSSSNSSSKNSCRNNSSSNSSSTITTTTGLMVVAGCSSSSRPQRALFSNVCEAALPVPNTTTSSSTPAMKKKSNTTSTNTNTTLTTTKTSMTAAGTSINNNSSNCRLAGGRLNINDCESHNCLQLRRACKNSAGADSVHAAVFLDMQVGEDSGTQHSCMQFSKEEEASEQLSEKTDKKTGDLWNREEDKSVRKREKSREIKKTGTTTTTCTTTTTTTTPIPALAAAVPTTQWLTTTRNSSSSRSSGVGALATSGAGGGSGEKGMGRAVPESEASSAGDVMVNAEPLFFSQNLSAKKKLLNNGSSSSFFTTRTTTHGAPLDIVERCVRDWLTAEATAKTRNNSSVVVQQYPSLPLVRVSEGVYLYAGKTIRVKLVNGELVVETEKGLVGLRAFLHQTSDFPAGIHISSAKAEGKTEAEGESEERKTASAASSTSRGLQALALRQQQRQQQGEQATNAHPSGSARLVSTSLASSTSLLPHQSSTASSCCSAYYTAAVAAQNIQHKDQSKENGKPKTSDTMYGISLSKSSLAALQARKDALFFPPPFHRPGPPLQAAPKTTIYVADATAPFESPATLASNAAMENRP